MGGWIGAFLGSCLIFMTAACGTVQPGASSFRAAASSSVAASSAVVSSPAASSASSTLSSASPVATPSLTAAVTNGVDSLFSFATGANAAKPGGVVGVVLDGKIIYQKAYGMAKVAENVVNVATAPSYLASASKQFTAMCVLLCREKGLLDLTNEIRQYIPELDAMFDGIQIRHLLYMISSIQDVGTGNVASTSSDMLIRLTQEGSYGVVSAQQPVGSHYKYCNMNYVLLGIIVERVSGQTLRQFMKAEIFNKLGMSETDLHDDPAMVINGQPNGYDINFAVWSTASNTAPGTGFTGVVTTIGDLVKWDRNFYTNWLGLSNQGLITLMETPGTYTSGSNSGQNVSDVGLGIPSYACALESDTYSGYKRIFHGGRWLGFKTGIYRYPELGLAVFVMLNRDDQYPPCQSVADVFFLNVCFVNNPPPSGVQGADYQFQYSATGAPRAVFTLNSGSLPDGLTLAADGTLSGTPTSSGMFSGTVKATCGARTNTQAFSIGILAAP